jgi:mannose-6-phosphate isomerase-like protein (cupin superfamily)
MGNDRIKVVPLESVEPILLGRGSWSRLLLTAGTVGAQEKLHSCLGFSVFVPGTSTPQKVHEAEELCYVLSGRGRLTVGAEAVEVAAAQALYIPAGVPHGVANPYEDDLVMVFVFSHPAYPPTVDA